MIKSTIKYILAIIIFASSNIKANPAIYNDIAKVKECWLKCRDDALLAGERALDFMQKQTKKGELSQPQVDQYTKLVKYFPRVFINDGNYERPKSIIDNYLSQSLQPTERGEKANILVSLGIIYYHTNQTILAENSYKQALQIHREMKNRSAQAAVLTNLGNVALERGLSAQAIDFYKESLKISEEQGLTKSAAIALNNLGIQLTFTEQFDLAEQYILRARELVKEGSNPRRKVEVIQAYGWLLISSKRLQEALDYLVGKEAFILESDLAGLQSHHYLQIGTIHEELGNFQLANEAFDKCIEIAKAINFAHSVDSASLGLARVAGKQGQLDAASKSIRNLLNKAIEAERFEFAERVHLVLVETLKNNQQYESAFTELSNYLDSFQSRIKKEAEDELSQHYALLDTEEERRKVAELQRDNAEQVLELLHTEKRRQKELAIFVFTALILLSIGLWLLQQRKIENIKTQAAEYKLTRKNELLSEITHELKTPITAIQLQIEVLEYDLALQPKEAYALVYKKIRTLNRLIDDVFQLSKADFKELSLHIEKTPAVPFLLKLAEAFKSQLEDAKIDFSVVNNASVDAVINIDRSRIEQVFVNLVSNTIRYTDVPGSCRLTLYSDENSFRISFEDSAPDVEDSDLERLFERLYREKSSRNKALSGSGLGLSIVSAFVEAHKGSIKAVKSELGGLRFDIELPLSV